MKLLSKARRDLGEKELFTGSATVRLNRDVVSCDLHEFEGAIATSARDDSGSDRNAQLEVKLFAAEPQLSKPIHMNFDAAGRLWVVGSSLYPQIEPGQVPMILAELEKAR